MKSLMEQTLNEFGIKTRADDGNIRPLDDVAEDLNVLLKNSDEEYVAKIIFAIRTANAVEAAAERIERNGK